MEKYNDNKGLLDGSNRPKQIPDDWEGEPLPDNQGWRWFNPGDRGDSVRIYSGALGEESHVVVTVKGEIIGKDGKPTGKRLND